MEFLHQSKVFLPGELPSVISAMENPAQNNPNKTRITLQDHQLQESHLRVYQAKGTLCEVIYSGVPKKKEAEII